MCFNNDNSLKQNFPEANGYCLNVDMHITKPLITYKRHDRKVCGLKVAV